MKSYTHGGRNETGKEAVSWCRYMAELGAGEILLTSMDRDGTRKGFNNELNRAVSEAVPVPLVASGGVGKISDFIDGAVEGKADALLAASIFHYGEATVNHVKTAMKNAGIEVRL